MVSQVLYYNQAQQYPGIQRDFKDVKGHVDSTEKTVEKLAIEAIPPVRRIASLPNKLDSGDVIPALGLTSLALINLPEDLRDITGARDQIHAALHGKKYQGAYDYKNYQHDFSFFRGTFLEPLVDTSKNGKLADRLSVADTTLLRTGFGRKIMELLKVEIKDVTEVKKFNKKTQTWELAKDVNGNQRYAYAFEGKGRFKAFGEMTARAMNRTTTLGVVALAALELPKIIAAMCQGNSISEQIENTTRQTTKSGISIASVTAGIAYGGAIGSKYGKGFGSLVGMGAGAVLGSLASDKIQEAIS